MNCYQRAVQSISKFIYCMISVDCITLKIIDRLYLSGNYVHRKRVWHLRAVISDRRTLTAYSRERPARPTPYTRHSNSFNLCKRICATVMVWCNWTFDCSSAASRVIVTFDTDTSQLWCTCTRVVENYWDSSSVVYWLNINSWVGSVDQKKWTCIQTTSRTERISYHIDSLVSVFW